MGVCVLHEDTGLVFLLICEVGQAFSNDWHEFLVFKEGFLDGCEGKSHGED